MRKLFDILLQQPDGLRGRDALAKLAAEVKPTVYEAGNFESGGRRLEWIVRFATIDAVKAGWLLKNKGQWTVTDAGKSAFAKYKDAEQFYREAVRLYRKWKEGQPEPETVEEAPDESSEKATSITFEQAEEQAWTEIETHLRNMPPYDFQELVASLLRGMSYHVSWVSPPGKDGGIDILAWSDPLGTKPPRIKVQVKRQTQSVNVDGLRSFMALLGDDDVGLFVSAGGFTKDAHDEARTQEKRRVTLLDLQRLVDLWVEHYEKLDEEGKRRLPLQPIYFLAPTP